MRRIVAGGEIVLAVLALLGAVLCWNTGVVTTEFAAMPDGTPAFASTHYSGSWIAVAAVAVLAAGLLLVDAVRRLAS